MTSDALKPVIDAFVEEARRLTLMDVWERLGPSGVTLRRVTVTERACACPVHGGADRDEFSMNLGKQVFLCRKTGDGGDPLAMAAHLRDIDLRRASRAQFLDVCARALGRDVPDGVETESDSERAAREQASAEARARFEAEQAARERDAMEWREKARRIAREKWERAAAADSVVRAYLAARSGFSPDPFPAAVRTLANEAWTHDADGDGKAERLYAGPAMILPFVGRDYAVIGCHRTWIDLGNAPKLRPEFFVLTKDGVAAGAPAWPVPVRAGGRPPADALAAGLYENQNSKKMLGTKLGGFLPVFGKSTARRWVTGEGIETVARAAHGEAYRADTFYCAAGDLGNLGGRADPAAAFTHPALKRADRNGVMRAVRVPGPVPAAGITALCDDAMPVFDHVDTLVLLADGDSERVFTASAMARAKARCARPGRRIAVVWPPGAIDFADLPPELRPGDA